MTGLASNAQLRMSFLRYGLATVPLVLLLGTVSGRVSGGAGSSRVARGVPQVGQAVSPGRTASQRGHQALIRRLLAG